MPRLRPPVHLSIIVPVWNGADALPRTVGALAAFARAQERRTELVFVDDGSGPQAATVLRRLAAALPDARVLSLPENRGKGAAVAAGMALARGRIRVFTDADLAYPAGEIAAVVEAVEQGADVAIASRAHPASRLVVAPGRHAHAALRLVAGRAFNALVRCALLPGIHDSQAGLKGFTAEAAALLFPRLTISGFGFDLECLYLARALGLSVVEMPVTVTDVGEAGSSVRLVRDGLRMMVDVATIRKRHAAVRPTARPARLPSTGRREAPPVRLRDAAAPPRRTADRDEREVGAR